MAERDEIDLILNFNLRLLVVVYFETFLREKNYHNYCPN